MRYAWRRLLSHVVVSLCGAAVLVSLVPLVLILFYVLKQGISSISWAFFTHMPVPSGETGGGMANGIVGSLIVTGLGAMFAIPVGVTAGVYASEYRGTRLANSIRFAADTLNGVPSIVIGVFAYGIAVLPFHHFSALGGRLRAGRDDAPAGDADDRRAATAGAAVAARRGAGARARPGRARSSRWCCRPRSPAS